MLDDGTRRDHARSALPELVAQLRKSCGAVASLHGGDTDYTEELHIFKKFAQENKLFLDQAPAILKTAPWHESNESLIWLEYKKLPAIPTIGLTHGTENRFN